MASQGRNPRYIRRRRLLGTVGALALASCGGSGDMGPCTPSNSSGLGSVSRSDTLQLTLQWFLDDDITDLVNFVATYSNCGEHDACNKNNNDGLYHASMVRTSTRDAADAQYVGVLTIGLRF